MKKKVNKKLALNKEKISELSRGNMGRIRGGGVDLPETMTFGENCLHTDAETHCFCLETVELACDLYLSENATECCIAPMITIEAI